MEYFRMMTGFPAHTHTFNVYKSPYAHQFATMKLEKFLSFPVYCIPLE